MSFWDHIKPTPKPPTGTAVELRDEGRTVEIQWDDGQTTKVGARLLRQVCPCAECVDEWTHERTLDVNQVPQDLRILEMGQVGNYALSFTFSDAHRTGIFNWSFLRETSEKNSR
jgi:DUF971 family protein